MEWISCGIYLMQLDFVQIDFVQIDFVQIDFVQHGYIYAWHPLPANCLRAIEQCTRNSAFGAYSPFY